MDKKNHVIVDRMGGKHLSPEMRAKAIRALEVIDAEPGTHLSEPLGPVPGMHLILKGVVGVHVNAGAEGVQWVDFLPENSVTLPWPENSIFESQFYLTTLLKSEVAIIPESLIRQMQSTELAWTNWALNMSLHQLSRKYAVQAIRAQPLEKKLLKLWWMLAQPSDDGSNRVFYGKLPQNLLASYFSAPREEISRKMQLLEKAGYITVTKNSVIVNAATHAVMPRVLPALLPVVEDVANEWSIY